MVVIRTAVAGVLMCFGAGLAAAEGSRREVTRVVRAESRMFPIEVTAPDPMKNRVILDTAERVWRLGQTVLLPLEDGKTRLRVRWVRVPAGMGGEEELEYPLSLRLERGMKVLVVDVGDRPEFSARRLARTCAAAYALACAWDGAMPTAGQEIVRPPYWLAEGMAARLVETRRDDWALVLARLHRVGRLPSLAEIQGWEGPGALVTEGHVRQAASYWLVRQALRTPVESRTLRLWLQQTRSDAQARYWSGREEELWWQRVAGERVPGDLPLLTWEQTAGRMREALHFPARLRGERETRVLSVMDLPENPEMLEGERSWAEVSGRLTQLKAQSHWLWVYVIERYNEALGAWAQGRTEDYRRLVAEAVIIQGRLDQTMSGAQDLLDWVTVNFPARGGGEDWVDFRELVEETERVRPGTGSFPRAGGVQ